MKKIILIAMSLMTVACSDKRNNQAQMDSALAKDLLGAATQVDTLGIVGAQERQDAQLRAIGYVPAPVVTPTTRTPVRTRTVYRDRPVYRSSGRTSTTRTVYTTPTRTTRTVKHTGRDAAIGAGAGAVIGAVTSHDKVKGAVVGGVAGAILGGVIGNNVDKTRR